MRDWLFAPLSILIALIAGCLAVGCSLDAPVGAAPEADGGGSGTGTLQVQVLIAAEASADEEGEPAQLETDLSVRVMKEGGPLEGAAVEITSAAGNIRPSPSEPGIYTAELTGYPRSFALAVAAGSDTLEAPGLVGPEAHTISAPTAGADHPSGQPLTVAWTPAGELEALVGTDEMPETATFDAGTFTVPATYLTASAGEAETDQVRVTRIRRTELVGGAEGSTVTFRVSNAVSFTITAP